MLTTIGLCLLVLLIFVGTVLFVMHNRQRRKLMKRAVSHGFTGFTGLTGASGFTGVSLIGDRSGCWCYGTAHSQADCPNWLPEQSNKSKPSC